MTLPMTHSYGKLLTTNSKSDDVSMEEMVNKIWELKIKFTRLEENNQSSKGSMKQSLGLKLEQMRGRLLPWCMWCDSFDHSWRKCEAFTKVL